MARDNVSFSFKSSDEKFLAPSKMIQIAIRKGILKKGRPFAPNDFENQRVRKKVSKDEIIVRINKEALSLYAMPMASPTNNELYE